MNNLEPFLHRDVILDNLRDMFELLGEFRDRDKEGEEFKALVSFHHAARRATGQGWDLEKGFEGTEAASEILARLGFAASPRLWFGRH